MNIFKGLLFLEGHIVDPSLLDDGFAAGYGNKAASERAFGAGTAAIPPEPQLGSCGAEPLGCG